MSVRKIAEFLSWNVKPSQQTYHGIFSQSVNLSGECKDQMHPWHHNLGVVLIPMGLHNSCYKARTVTDCSPDGVASQLLWLPKSDQSPWLMGFGNTCYAAQTVTDGSPDVAV